MGEAEPREEPPVRRAGSGERRVAEVSKVRDRDSGSGPTNAATLRTSLKPGDVGRIVEMHGVLYALELGFDRTFEAYVAGPLAECVRAGSARDRIWIAEIDGRLAGCVAIVAASPRAAQLRWFLVDPDARGRGLGTRLLREAVAFCEVNGYESVTLWTVGALTAAAHLYRAAGFRKVEEKPGRRWGTDVVEERYELGLT
ncbi:MAG: GNAT family N-acetyltransferase [Acidobacteriia bacterium]|nr:GNAT family N-acetyltransferase [Terriglobia bacterium]